MTRVNGVDLLDRGDMVVLSYTRNGSFEPETFAFLETLKPKGTFSDIGAYTGLYGIWAAKRGYKVQMFEPNPPVYERMLYNMFDNNVIGNCYNVALSDTDTHLSFYTNPKTPLSSAGSLIADRKKTQQYDVSVYPYNYFATGNESVIKIDVEGGELNVLKGMDSTLMFEKPVLIIEVLDREKENEVVAFLKPYGYNSLGLFDERNLILSV